MSSPLTLDDHRCPGCGRVARVVRHESADAPAAPVGDDGCVLNLFPEDPSATTSVDRAAFWLMDCCCDRFHRSLGTPPTLRGLLTREDGITIGPGLGRLLVEALERRSVVAGPSRDEIRATLHTLPADEVLEWAVIGASPPAPNCGHRGPDGCCNYPGHVSAECHAGVPCPLVTIASAPRPSWRWAIPVGPGLSPLIPPDLRGLAFQPEEAAALAAAAHGSADPEDPILEGLKEVVQTARMMRGRTFEPAYTPAPPPPSPDGDTYYRYRSVERSPDIRDAWVCWMVVRGDRMDLGDEFSAAIDPSGSGGYQGVPLSRWTAGEPLERTLHPVPRPEWAEGEGTHSARSLRFPAEVTCACPDGFKPQSQGVGIGCEECKSYLHPGDEHYAALDAWMRAQDDEG